ncbi:MAG: hypothetical protein F6K18_07595 [Okeania sp. SIO2C2]|uniref:hypothetical protein n=1 Tax=Okeania sp. SIO2C2 TaxID=2607787 RepID=UPI0013BE1AA7|nr:hypothetical protein [Okeania sp. SIO2C2]NEP86703.1 hypothetical protein [Okeania sp. SIO2C2]
MPLLYLSASRDDDFLVLWCLSISSTYSVTKSCFWVESKVMRRGKLHRMVKSYHNFFEDARGKSLPFFFGASQDDDILWFVNIAIAEQVR